MGRAERRRKERMDRIQERKEKVLVSRDDIQAMKKRATKKALEFNGEILMTCFALALHRSEGFGYKRIFRVLTYLDSLMDPVEKGEMSIEDYIQILEDETGIVVKCEDE